MTRETIPAKIRDRELASQGTDLVRTDKPEDRPLQGRATVDPETVCTRAGIQGWRIDPERREVHVPRRADLVRLAQYFSRDLPAYCVGFPEGGWLWRVRPDNSGA